MHQIIYTSIARPGLLQEDVFQIVEQSARNNPSADITGFLLFRKGKFLQLVEGPLMALETLLARLAEDDRHRDLEVVSRLPIAQRSFPRWRMRRVGGDRDALDELEQALTGEGGGLPIPQAVRDFVRETIDA
jgi:hypothetical protein